MTEHDATARHRLAPGWHRHRKRPRVILIAKPVPHSVTVFGTGLRRCGTQGGAGLHGLTAGENEIRTAGPS